MITYSIIIPHFESLDVLHRAVESVPEREDIEVLIIDNSCTPIDKHLFAERRNVRILFSPFGKGAGAARNVGLEQAKGLWLLFMDADDYFTQAAFEAMDRYTYSPADIVFFKLTSCYSEDGSPATRHLDFNQLYGDGLRYSWSSPCGKMIRSALVREHSIRFEERHAANDVYFSLLTGYYAHSVESVDAVIYCATIHKGSLTQTPSLQNLTDRVEAFCLFNRFVRQHHLTKFSKSVLYYIYLAYRLYGSKKAVKLLLYSIRLGNNPFIGCTRWLKTYSRIQ